jgi:acyl-coenzyme A synthetase/AMP-(fatty) acid ligase
MMPTRAEYEELRRTFRLEVPDRFNYTRDVLYDRAQTDPDSLALVAVEPDGRTVERYDFATIADRVKATAAVLAERGVGAGDRVFLMLPRIVQWYDVLLGCLHLGAVPMPATMQLSARDVAYRVNLADATTVVTDTTGAAAVGAALPDCPVVSRRLLVGGSSPGWDDLDAAVAGVASTVGVRDTAADDPMLIYFTSGTESHPKMVLHTHASYGIGHDITAGLWQDLRADDVHWTVSDTGWGKAAWGKLFGQWRIGAAVLMWNVVGKPDLDRMLRIIGEQGVSTFCVPPTLYRGFAQMDLSAYDFSSLRHCTSAGEPLNPEVIKVWQEATGTVIHDGYGQTETVAVVANLPGIPVRAGSMGLALPGFDVAVIDETGAQVPDGSEGDIAVRAEPHRPVGLFTEYWRDPERSAAAHRGGWYVTGDRGIRDADGYFWFVGRADDVILSSAYRIGPFEVESALLEHPAVAEAAVVGVPDEIRGQIVGAFVVLAAGHEPGDDLVVDLQNHVKATTAPYKYPRRIEFTAELPKTVSGKIRRVDLRNR